MESQKSRKENAGRDGIKQIGDIISDLKESPIFNMSLASKELFHSNFIAWVLVSNFKGVDGILKLFYPDLPKDLVVHSVDREVSNFDLRIWFRKKNEVGTIERKDRYNIVIENKVKSLPDEEQLKKYSKSLNKEKKSDSDKTTCVLLSLTPPTFFDAGLEISGYSWRFASYEKLADVLNNLTVSGYPKQLIGDYVKFINHLCSLRDACKYHWESESNLISYGDTLYSQMNDIRLHDIYEKWRMEAVKCKLTTYPNFPKKVVLTVDYTNGGGILNIDPKDIGGAKKWQKIQIQGHQLRQVLQYEEGDSEIFEEAKNLMEKKKWFRPLEAGWSGNKQKKTEKKNDFGFCKYDSSFAYRHEDKWDIDRVIELAQKVKVLG